MLCSQRRLQTSDPPSLHLASAGILHVYHAGIEPRASCLLESSLPSCILSPQISLFSLSQQLDLKSFLFFFYETESYYIALAALELTTMTRLA